MDMDWTFASTPDAAPAWMSREEQREHAFPHFSSFDDAEALAPPRVLAHQVGCGSCCCVFKQPPFAMNDPAPSSTVGVRGTRDVHRPKTAQLTILYAGSVSVFDNVSAETAQELVMLLASRGSLPSSALDARKPEEAPIFAPTKVTVPEVSAAEQMPYQKPHHVSPPPSDISKPISGMHQAANLPRNASSSNVDSTVPLPKSSSPLAVPPISQAPPTQPAALAAKTAAAKAAPQARKASLARFLEKRKERASPGHKVARRFYVVETKMAPRSRVEEDNVSVSRDAATHPVSGDYGATTAASYPPAKSPLESSDTIGSANNNEKSSCTDIALSSNREESLCLGQPRNISLHREHPSTKLQI